MSDIHPHILAQEQFQKIVNDQRFSEQERAEAKKNLFVVDGIVALATSITKAYPDICYMNACDLVDEFLYDPMQEQD